jgi:ABC-type glycerol-3-phosphate transport system permease component
MRQGKLALTLLYGGLTVFSLLWLVPVMTAFMTSIRPLDEIRGGWWNFDNATFTFNNYVRAWDQGLASFVANSFIITLGSVAVTVATGALATYAFVHLSFRFKRLWFFLLITTMIVPIQLILIPLLPWFRTLGLDRGAWQFIGIVLVHTGFGAGWAVFMLSSFFRAVPKEMLEAGQIDGASHWDQFRRLVLPLALPGIVSFAIIDFIFVWNDLLLALTLLQREFQPIQVGLANLQSPHLAQQDLVSAGAILAILPPLVLFSALNRYYVRGLFAGGTKG